MQRENAYAKPIEVTCCSSSLFSPCLFVSVSLSVFTFLFGLVLFQTQMVNDRVADMDIRNVKWGLGHRSALFKKRSSYVVDRSVFASRHCPVDFRWHGRWSWTSYLQHLTTHSRLVGPRFLLPSCMSACFEKMLRVRRDQPRSAYSVHKTSKNWVSEPCCNNDIYAPVDVVSHVIFASGSGFLGDYQNKTFLTQPLKKIR